MNWDKKALKVVGITRKSDEVKKIAPDPKSIRPTKVALRMLNKAFGRPETKLLQSTIFYGFFPWEKNPTKIWYLIVDSLPAASDKRTKVIEKVIRKKYPEYKFKIMTKYSDIYFPATENLGTWLGKKK